MLSKGQILDMWSKEIKSGCEVEEITEKQITVLEIHPRGFANEYTHCFFKDVNKAKEYQSNVNDDVDAMCYLLEGKEKSNGDSIKFCVKRIKSFPTGNNWNIKISSLKGSFFLC